MLVVLIDKMLKTQIVECAAVANWVFSKEMVPEFTKCYIWEIVHLTIRYLPEGELFYLTPIPSPGTFLLPFFQTRTNNPLVYLFLLLPLTSHPPSLILTVWFFLLFYKKKLKNTQKLFFRKF